MQRTRRSVVFQPVYLRCDPKPFRLIQPFDQHGLPKSPNALLLLGGAPLTGPTFSEQLIQWRNLPDRPDKFRNCTGRGLRSRPLLDRFFAILATSPVTRADFRRRSWAMTILSGGVAPPSSIRRTVVRVLVQVKMKQWQTEQRGESEAWLQGPVRSGELTALPRVAACPRRNSAILRWFISQRSTLSRYS